MNSKLINIREPILVINFKFVLSHNHLLLTFATLTSRLKKIKSGRNKRTLVSTIKSICIVLLRKQLKASKGKNLDFYRLLFDWATFPFILFSQDGGYIDISFVALESNKSLWIKDLQNHFLSVRRLAVCLRWQRFKEFLPKIYYSKWPVVIKPRWLFH